MALQVKVAGTSELRRRLSALPANARAEVTKAIDKSGAEVASMAAALAPVDQGDLKASITHQMADDGLSAKVGSNEVHATFAEFGTKERPAQPFLFPSYRALKKRITGRIGRAVKKAATMAGVR
ncbi:MAG: HK97-gp10 family putative phage morphogenesis protein [Pseudomonadota bacterium]|nr:HK97-gp10 family putative phage morphogenesis protein [Pseudomonadota bacterium]